MDFQLTSHYYYSRVNCYSKTCRDCSQCTGVEKDKKGREFFSCPHHGEKKHQEIKARDCESFRCNNANKDLLCEWCNKGEGK